MFKEKICDYCGNYFTPTGGCQKYCPYCRYTVSLIKARYNDKRRRGFKGRNQPKGKESPFYKNGIKHYPDKAKFSNATCKFCSSSVNLVVHHIDMNRENNDDSNLMVLCRKCHQRLHNAKTYEVFDKEKNFIMSLVGRAEILEFLLSNGIVVNSDLSLIRRAIRNGTKAYGYYWKRH